MQGTVLLCAQCSPQGVNSFVVQKNPEQYIGYLIDDMNDPVGGCDVAGHKVSTLKGQVLHKGEERGFAFALLGWCFPATHPVHSHTFPNACLGMYHGTTNSHQRLGDPQGTTQKGGDLGTLGCSLGADCQTLVSLRMCISLEISLPCAARVN